MPSADFTGSRKKKLQDQHAEELAEREKELALISESRKREKDEGVVDYTVEKKPVPPAQPVDYSEYDDDPTIAQIVADAESPAPELLGEAANPSTKPVKLERTVAIIRAREDMNAVTVGKGTKFDFEAGRQYKVPIHVAEHLAGREVADILG
jgi:hypothetical protein